MYMLCDKCTLFEYKDAYVFYHQRSSYRIIYTITRGTFIYTGIVSKTDISPEWAEQFFKIYIDLIPNTNDTPKGIAQLAWRKIHDILI